MSANKFCLIKSCNNEAVAGLRGLCANCNAAADKLVKSGATSWQQLEAMKLAVPEGATEFDIAFAQATKPPGYVEK